MVETISHWAYIQSKAEVECPLCGAVAHQSCRSPTGARGPVHASRIGAYRDQIGQAEWQRRHPHQRERLSVPASPPAAPPLPSQGP